MSPKEAIDELTYRSFRHNVLQNPQIPVARWETIYGSCTEEFTARLKTETQKN